MEKIILSLTEQKRWTEPGLENDRRIHSELENVESVEYKYLSSIESVHEQIAKSFPNMESTVHLQFIDQEQNLVNLASRNFESELHADVIAIINSINPAVISAHIGFSASELNFGSLQDYTVAKSGPLGSEEIIDAINYNVGLLKKFFPNSEIILENLDYTPKELSGAYEYICSPDFITEIIQKNHLGMLLDFAHANVSAKNLGFEYKEYIKKLPLQEVVEVHLSRSGQKANLAFDSHMPILDAGACEEIEMFKNLLKTGSLPKLKIVNLETYSEVEPQIKILRDLLDSQ